MIGRLHGELLELSGGELLIDVGGVGYEVEVATSVLELAPVPGEMLTLFTHFVVREDAQLLFGFAAQAERDLFRAFIKINGVGPKMGLALISSLDVPTLATAVRTEDISVLTRVPGVGKKTAERLMVELKSRLNELSALVSVPLNVADVASVMDGPTKEAEDALMALGYRRDEASRTIAGVLAKSEGEVGVEEIVRMALRSFASEKEAGSKG